MILSCEEVVNLIIDWLSSLPSFSFFTLQSSSGLAAVDAFLEECGLVSEDFAVCILIVKQAQPIIVVAVRNRLAIVVLLRKDILSYKEVFRDNLGA